MNSLVVHRPLTVTPDSDHQVAKTTAGARKYSAQLKEVKLKMSSEGECGAQASSEPRIIYTCSVRSFSISPWFFFGGGLIPTRISPRRATPPVCTSVVLTI